MPASGSMYQSVSMPSCCSPLELLPWFTTQMLNHVGLVILPSGFSEIRTSFRGIPARKPVCANACPEMLPASKLAVRQNSAAFIRGYADSGLGEEKKRESRESPIIWTGFGVPLSLPRDNGNPTWRCERSQPV